MGLSAEDLQAIGSLMDSKLSAVQAADRRRRRWWFWFWVLFFIVSTVISGIYAQKYLEMFKEEMAKIEDDLRESKIAYQTQLAQSVPMQVERKKAELVSGYDNTQSQADYEAALLRSTFRIVGESQALNERMKNLDPDDPDALVTATKDMSDTMQMALGTIGQIMLRNTDPALNSPDENLLLGETAGATPAQAAGTSTTPTMPTTKAPPRIYTPPE
jgi:hypothetical protein